MGSADTLAAVQASADDALAEAGAPAPESPAASDLDGDTRTPGGDLRDDATEPTHALTRGPAHETAALTASKRKAPPSGTQKPDSRHKPPAPIADQPGDNGFAHMPRRESNESVLDWIEGEAVNGHLDKVTLSHLTIDPKTKKRNPEGTPVRVHPPLSAATIIAAAPQPGQYNIRAYALNTKHDRSMIVTNGVCLVAPQAWEIARYGAPRSGHAGAAVTPIAAENEPPATAGSPDEVAELRKDIALLTRAMRSKPTAPSAPADPMAQMHQTIELMGAMRAAFGGEPTDRAGVAELRQHYEKGFADGQENGRRAGQLDGQAELLQERTERAGADAELVDAVRQIEVLENQLAQIAEDANAEDTEPSSESGWSADRSKPWQAPGSGGPESVAPEPRQRPTPLSGSGDAFAGVDMAAAASVFDATTDELGDDFDDGADDYDYHDDDGADADADPEADDDADGFNQSDDLGDLDDGERIDGEYPPMTPDEDEDDPGDGTESPDAEQGDDDGDDNEADRQGDDE